MTEQLIWNATVRVDGGPQLTGSNTIPIDAYTKVSESVANNNDLTVDIGPDGDGKVACCVALVPDRKTEHLTYRVGGKSIALDQPQFLFGGAVGLVGDELTIQNADGDPVSIEVLIGRRNPPEGGPAPANKAQPAKAQPAKAPAAKAPAKKAPPP
ncbi:hypothetical protein ACXYX3_14330 [Mycobacterium sp. C3-094]